MNYLTFDNFFLNKIFSKQEDKKKIISNLNQLISEKKKFQKTGNIEIEFDSPKQENLNDLCPVGLNYSHYEEMDKFEEFFIGNGFEKIKFLGLESFSTSKKTLNLIKNFFFDKQNENEEIKNLILDIIESNCETKEAIGKSNHSLFIGKFKK
jgi:hypothetical protein